MVELRDQERKTLLALKKLRGEASLQQLVAETQMTDAAVMRATLVLQEKNLAHISETILTFAKPTAEAKIHAKRGLPERRMVSSLEKLGGKASLAEVIQESGLQEHLIPIALGWIQRKNWAVLDPNVKLLHIRGKPERGFDERLLKTIVSKGEAVLVEGLQLRLQEAVPVLKSRKLLEVEKKTSRTIKLTEEGHKIVRKNLRAVEKVTQLTPELIISGKWRKAKLQRYNIEAPVATTWPGKKHPYLQFLDFVRQKLVALGFKEMSGTVVETCFFNFDALFTPQGHPARESSDVYYIESPKYGNLERYQQIAANVKNVHENGWKTGSRGWRYGYSVKEPQRLILRSHTTCLSARTLLSKELDIPGMYFSLGRCYRPEIPDKTHLTEFNQVEGIAVNEDLTLRDLLGILQKFAIDIADADQAKFVPDYFPFTEPSVELRAYKRNFGWIEFGGSGILRPEVTMPLGVEVPVLAWGLGIDRLFMLKTGIDDIRQIFSSDLDWLRRQKAV